MPAATTPSSGILCLLKVNTGTPEIPVYTSVGAQRNATLKMDGKEIDVTSKDSGGWEENVPGTKSWAIDCDGLYMDGDAAQTELEDAYMAGDQIMVNVVTPSGRLYAGTATITSLEIAAPHDKEMTNKVSLKGSGALTPTPAV